MRRTIMNRSTLHKRKDIASRPQKTLQLQVESVNVSAYRAHQDQLVPFLRRSAQDGASVMSARVSIAVS